MISVENLNKSYKGTQVLKDVNLQVDAGELFAFLGPNGAGKTTMIRILTGLTRLTSGRASINGIDLQDPGIERRRVCGLVTQSINLDMELTVLENMKIHGRLFRMPAANKHVK